MTLDTEAASTTPETPAPEAKAPEPKTPDILQEQLSESEQIAAAEREELRKAYRKAQAAREPEPKEPEEVKGPIKDPVTGKFVSPLKEEIKVSDDHAKAEKPEAKSDVKAQSDQKPAPKTEEVKKPAVEAPKHWSDKVKAEFAKLDPEAQESLAKESTEMRQTISRQGRFVKEMEPVAKVVQENKAVFDKYGVTPDQGIAALLRAQAMLENPNTARDAILQLARQYNVNLGHAETQQADDDWVDPNVAQLRDHVTQQHAVIQQLHDRLAQFERHTVESQQQAQVDGLTGVVQAYAKSVPDWSELPEDVLEGQIRLAKVENPEAPPEQILEIAVERARWATPALREKAIQAEIDKKSKLMEQARQAAALNVQSEPDPSMATNEREIYRQIYRKHHAA